MFGYESDTCGRSYTIRIRYVWTQIFLYPHKKICGYKNLRIRVDGALYTANGKKIIKKKYYKDEFLMLVYFFVRPYNGFKVFTNGSLRLGTSELLVCLKERAN